MTVSRRNFMVAGAALAGALAAPAFLKGQQAQAQTRSGKMRREQAPAFYRTKVGGVTVTTILDGGMTLPDKALLNADTDDVAAMKRENFVPAGDSFPAFISAFLIEEKGKFTLIDTGAGDYAPTTGHLITRLKAAGVAPEDIGRIVMTHLHPDHAGGLVTQKGRAVFKNASLHIAEEELSFWTNQENAAKFPDKKQMFDGVVANIDPYKKQSRIETFKLGSDLGGALSSVNLSGHTPGHGGVRISDGRDQLLIWADIVHIPAVQFEEPKIGIGFDLDPDRARAAREKIFDEVTTDRLRIMGSHLWHPPVGHVEKRSGGGYRFVAQMWEADV